MQRFGEPDDLVGTVIWLVSDASRLLPALLFLLTVDLWRIEEFDDAMTLRWFGGADSVRLEQIDQIPCMRGIVRTFEDIPVEVFRWNAAALKATVEAWNLYARCDRSIPVAEAIKLGPPSATLDRQFCQSIRNMGARDSVVCYNFMPVFDWMRTNLAYAARRFGGAALRPREIRAYDWSRGLEGRVAWARGFTGEEFRVVRD